jgi:hypothetical protein
VGRGGGGPDEGKSTPIDGRGEFLSRCWIMLSSAQLKFVPQTRTSISETWAMTKQNWVYHTRHVLWEPSPVHVNRDGGCFSSGGFRTAFAAFVVAAAEIRRNHAKDCGRRPSNACLVTVSDVRLPGLSESNVLGIYLTTFIQVPFPHISSASSPQAPHV